MKTFKLIKTLFLCFIASSMFGQYTETFPLNEKGILLGPCPGGTWQSCALTDFDGVDWEINGNFTGFDASFGVEDYLKTIAGVLEFGGDIDEELCYESPVLDISTVVGSVSFSVAVVWTGHDAADYVDVEYQLDGGAWIQIPNAFGGGTHTIDFSTSANNGSGTISGTGLTGSTLSIRVCVDTNTSAETTTIDNVSVPEVGAMILPVKWADFKVRSLKEGNQLDWATYTEVNNERFDIEKSVEGMNDFRKIGSIDGVGNSTRISRYEFLDREISTGTSYYRIKQVDFDEKFEYSEIVLVKNEIETEISIYPNPADGFIIVNSVSGIDIDQQFQVYDAMGRLMNLETSKENDYAVRLNTSSLESGIYFIKLSSGNIRKVIKL